MSQTEKDLFGRDFAVGTYVSVRCVVNSITPVSALGAVTDLVNLTVETPGNLGEQAGVTFNVSPTQCRFAGATYQR